MKTKDFHPSRILSTMLNPPPPLFKNRNQLSAFFSPTTVTSIIEHEVLTACVGIINALNLSAHKDIEYQQILGPENANGSCDVYSERFSNQTDPELLIDAIKTIISHLPYSKIDREEIMMDYIEFISRCLR